MLKGILASNIMNLLDSLQTIKDYSLKITIVCFNTELMLLTNMRFLSESLEHGKTSRDWRNVGRNCRNKNNNKKIKNHILCHFIVCTVFVTCHNTLKTFPYFCKDRQATTLTGFSCNRASQWEFWNLSHQLHLSYVWLSCESQRISSFFRHLSNKTIEIYEKRCGIEVWVMHGCTMSVASVPISALTMVIQIN